MSEFKESFIYWIFDRFNEAIEFLFHHSLKDTFLNPKCNPKVVWEKGANVIILNHCDILNTNAEVENRVNAFMLKEKAKYPLTDLDVYHNMRLALPGELDKASVKNHIIEDFLGNKEREMYSKISTELMGIRMKPVQFQLFNNGRKGCGQLQVLITFTEGGEYVFDSSACEEHDFEGKNLVNDWENTLRFNNIMYPSVDYDTYWFNYDEWNLDSPIGNNNTSEYRIEYLNALYPDKKSIPSFYVDTAMAKKIILYWQIFESTLESPNEGYLEIHIENNK